MGRECTHARILMSVNNRSVNITLVWKSCGNGCCEMCIANGGEISAFLNTIKLPVPTSLWDKNWIVGTYYHHLDL